MPHRNRERRRHERTDLSCPLIVMDGNRRVLFKIRTANISDGGLYIETPASNLPDSGMPDEVQLRISVPRSTPNSFMLEDFQTHARLVRAEPLANDDGAGIAMEFPEPLKFELDA